MRNEIPVRTNITDKDGSSFDKKRNVRVLEMSLITELKENSTIANEIEVIDSLQSQFSNIFQDDDILTDDNIIY